MSQSNNSGFMYKTHQVKESRTQEEKADDICNNESGDAQETNKKKVKCRQTESHPPGIRCYTLTVVCLVLPCVLLAPITVWLHIRCNNLTSERDQLQSINNNLTKERDRLQTNYSNPIKDSNQLQTNYSNPIKDSNQLQTNYSKLIKERDQLQTNYSNLIKERDQLQTNYSKLIKERDQLQTNYSNLIKERDQLQTSYSNLINERDQLETNYGNLINVKNSEIGQLKRRLFERDNMIQNGWRYYRSRMYYISTKRKSWSESREECKKRGADLVIIHSNEEQEFIEILRGGESAWIGLKNTDGVWKWVDGTELSTGYWTAGQRKDECVITGYSSDKILNWADFPCSNRFLWICAKDFIE